MKLPGFLTGRRFFDRMGSEVALLSFGTLLFLAAAGIELWLPQHVGI